MVRWSLAVVVLLALVMACRGVASPPPPPTPYPTPTPVPTPTSQSTPFAPPPQPSPFAPPPMPLESLPRVIPGSTGIASPDQRIPAPDFPLTLFSGQQTTLSTLRGHIVVLNFWASWCPPCRSEMPQFERAWQTWQGQGVAILGVATGDRPAEALAFAQQVGVTYPLGLDADGRIAVAYRVTTLPTTYFLDREGRIARRIVGYVNEGYLRFVLTSLIQETPP